MRLIIQEEKNACHQGAGLEDIGKEDERTDDEGANRRNEDRTSDQVLDHPHIGVDTRLRHVKHALKRRIHELKREDEDGDEGQDGPLIG